MRKSVALGGGGGGGGGGGVRTLSICSPGTLLDVQNVGLNPRLAECFHFRKISR